MRDYYKTYYKLDGHQAVPCDVLEWAKSLSNKHRIVGVAFIGDVRISTVFLGLNHSFDNGPPLLFETMIFGGKFNDDQRRCTTWEEAEQMHREMCEKVCNG